MTFGVETDEGGSHEQLDRFVEAGGTLVDTADVYGGGQSEEIIGRWFASRPSDVTERVVLATKGRFAMGNEPNSLGLSTRHLTRALDASLSRLGLDRVDLYQVHAFDPLTPLEETLGAFDALVREGKVRYIAASQYTAPRLVEALAVSQRNGLARYVALQTHYSLVHRSEYESALADVCVRENVAVLPFFALARGFLSGKYRPGKDVASARASGVKELVGEKGWRVLEPLDQIAAAHRTTVSAVALAWTAAQKGIAVPLASARTRAQLDDLVPYAGLVLTQGEIARLTAVSADIG